ncbi:MAG: amidohydrolase [Thermoleophilia bacterium]
MAAPNLVLANVNVITMDPTLPAARTIGIRAGRICWVSAKDTRPPNDHRGPKENVIDCQGKTVVPGFIDAHCHLVSYAHSLVGLDAGPRTVSSIMDLQNLVAQAVRETPPGSWILGRGYSEFHLAEKRHPTRWDLDAVSPAHPVSIAHHSGHVHLLNSLALHRVGISMETGDPPSGLIDRDIPTGEPTGLLFGMNEFIAPFVSPAQESQADGGIGRAGEVLAANGVTSVFDASARNDLGRRELFRTWSREARLPQRISMAVGWGAFQKMMHEDTARPNDDPVPVRGVKIILHEITGRLSPSRSELKEMIMRIHTAGHQAILHAIEQEHIIAACTAIEEAQRAAPAAGRGHPGHRVEHCSVCPPELAKRLATAGVTVVTQPAFLYYNGERYLKTVPELDLKHLYPVGRLLRSGVTVAGSSDFPVIPPNPLIGIYAAVTRRAENAEPVLPEERISPVEALSLFTASAAKAIGAEALTGSIKPGMFADLAVLSADPTAVAEEAIKDIRVDMTLIGGQVVWERG